MRGVGSAVLVLACLVAGQAGAGVKVVQKVETYRIAGDSGRALMAAMDRSGPRHGFLARAIAQTKYSVAWDLGWAMSGERCRLKTADVTLSVNYRFPALAGTPSDSLDRRWTAFMAGVQKHERTHGRIAREMADAAYRAAMKVRTDADPSCRKAKAEVTRIVHDTYDVYEKRQQRFDAMEHQPGGKVDRLVAALTRKR